MLALYFRLNFGTQLSTKRYSVRTPIYWGHAKT
jgi:hypothetical protein